MPMHNLSPIELFKAWKALDPLTVAKAMAMEAFTLDSSLTCIEFDFIDDDGSPWIMLERDLTQDQADEDEEDRVCFNDYSQPDGFPDFDAIAPYIRLAYVEDQNSVRITREDLA